MRTAILALSIAAGLAVPPGTVAHAAPTLVLRRGAGGEPAAAVQPVWYDRWGRWHPPAYRYGYRPLPPGYYAYHRPPGPYWRHRYWHHRRVRCLRYGWC